jgi:hypothetical protein
MSQKEFADKLNKLIRSASPLSGSLSSKALSAPEKYASHDQPDSQKYILPVIVNNQIPVPVPVSSGPVAFVNPRISNPIPIA